jgi:hypothetical protein
MGTLDIVRAIMGSKRLKEGRHWQASHKIDGKQTKERPQVAEFDCGLQDGELWLRFRFTEKDDQQADTPHELKGIFSFNNKNDQIVFDDTEVEEDDVVISHRFRGFEVRGVLEFEFLKGTESHRYRFDATILKGF